MDQNCNMIVMNNKVIKQKHEYMTGVISLKLGISDFNLFFFCLVSNTHTHNHKHSI